jgi:hypothetical protein
LACLSYEEEPEQGAMSGHRRKWGEGKMKKKYMFGKLSKSERETLEQILLEEMEIQTWYAVLFSSVMGGETLISIQ